MDCKDLEVTLKDERLQRLLRGIDGAANRERALEGALQGDEAFRAVGDKLLALLQPK